MRHAREGDDGAEHNDGLETDRAEHPFEDLTFYIRDLPPKCRDAPLNHRYEVTSGVLEEECAKRLSTFFAALRARTA